MKNEKLLEDNTLKVVEDWYKQAYMNCRRHTEDYTEELCNLSVYAHMKCMLKDMHYSPAEITFLEKEAEKSLKIINS